MLENEGSGGLVHEPKYLVIWLIMGLIIWKLINAHRNGVIQYNSSKWSRKEDPFFYWLIFCMGWICVTGVIICMLFLWVFY